MSADGADASERLEAGAGGAGPSGDAGAADRAASATAGAGAGLAEAPGVTEGPAGRLGGDPLVALAREAVEEFVRTGRRITAVLPPGAGPERAGAFVSLHLPDGSLRGCLGTIGPTRDSLADEIVTNAISAASRDPRFYPMRPEELDGLHISVDVLGEPEEVTPELLDPRTYGLIVRTDDGRQALLLPDLDGVDTAEQQLQITCRKGGIDPRRDRYRLLRFEVTRHT